MKFLTAYAIADTPKRRYGQRDDAEGRKMWVCAQHEPNNPKERRFAAFINQS
jgi:hypothetical protein